MSKLKDLVVPISSSLKLSQLEKSGKHIVYGASGPCGYINSYKVDKDYIALVKDGAGVGHVFKINAKESFLGTMQGLIPKDGIDPNYVYYLIRHLNLGSTFDGATIPHIYFKNYGNCLVRDHNFQEQIKIAHNLGMLDESIKHRLILLNNLDELIKSRFVEMFGDPVANPKGWQVKPLLEMGKCKNGMNFHYDDSGVDIPCLGVGDFKDHSFITDVKTLSTVSLNEMPSEEYLLHDGDIVFVRSNGNKALVGRSVAVYPGDIPTTFSGFCIRYRKKDNNITIPYLLRVLKSDSVRSKMTGSGANIQNLNQQILSTLVIPVPPVDLQERYNAFVIQVDKSKSIVQQQIKDLQELLDKKMDEYFSS